MSGGISATTFAAYASLAVAAAGTAMSVVGTIQQSGAAAQAARYQAQVGENTKKIAEWQAKDATERGKIAEDRRRETTALQIGRQRAAMGSQGADVNDGTNVDILSDTAAAGEFDALTIRNNSEREAYGYKVSASNAAAGAELQRMRASSTEDSAWIGAGANLLAGASSVGDKWASYKKQGLL